MPFNKDKLITFDFLLYLQQKTGQWTTSCFETEGYLFTLESYPRLRMGLHWIGVDFLQGLDITEWSAIRRMGWRITELKTGLAIKEAMTIGDNLDTIISESLLYHEGFMSVEDFIENKREGILEDGFPFPLNPE